MILEIKQLRNLEEKTGIKVPKPIFSMLKDMEES